MIGNTQCSFPQSDMCLPTCVGGCVVGAGGWDARMDLQEGVLLGGMGGIYCKEALCST